MAMLGRQGYVQRHQQAVAKQAIKVTLTATQAQAATLSNVFGRTLTAAQTQAASLIRQAQPIRTAQQAQAASLPRAMGWILTALQAQLATVDPLYEHPSHQFLIDWNDNDDYSDVGDDVTVRVWPFSGVSSMRGKDQIRVLSPPAAGMIQWSVDNRSRDYSTENTSSPLYPAQAQPGHQMQWRFTQGGVTYYIAAGRLDDIPQNPQFEDRTVEFDGIGNLSFVVGSRTITTNLYVNITVDVALNAILDLIGWPAGKRNIQTGITVMLLWYLVDADPFDAMTTLLNTEGPGASLYEDGQGNIVFENRNFRSSAARATTPQAVWDANDTEPLFDPDTFKWNPNLQNIVNHAELTVNQRQLQATGVVWTSSGDIVLGINETSTVPADVSDPVQNAQTPTVAAGDYTVTAGAVTSLTIDRTSGGRVTITIVAGPAGATVSGLRLRADAYKLTNKVKLTNINPVPPNPYGVVPYQGTVWPELAPNDAQDILNGIIIAFEAARATANIGFTIQFGIERLRQFTDREVSDRVTVIEPQTGASTDVYIENRQASIVEEGRFCRILFGVEKIAPGVALYARWGFAQWGMNTWAF